MRIVLNFPASENILDLLKNKELCLQNQRNCAQMISKLEANDRLSDHELWHLQEFKETLYKTMAHEMTIDSHLKKFLC